jgi:histidinol dehydrogenase
VEAQLVTLGRAAIARKSWDDFGVIIVTENLAEAVSFANSLARSTWNWR